MMRFFLCCFSSGGEDGRKPQKTGSGLGPEHPKSLMSGRTRTSTDVRRRSLQKADGIGARGTVSLASDAPAVDSTLVLFKALVEAQPLANSLYSSAGQLVYRNICASDLPFQSLHELFALDLSLLAMALRRVEDGAVWRGKRCTWEGDGQSAMCDSHACAFRQCSPTGAPLLARPRLTRPVMGRGAADGISDCSETGAAATRRTAGLCCP